MLRLVTRIARTFLPVALGAAACVGGCYSNQKGVSPPDTNLYFPTGLALSNARAGATTGPHAGSRWLFVVNSNFDLRYDAGWLSAIDLDAVADAMNDTGCLFNDPKPDPATGKPKFEDCLGLTDAGNAAHFIKATVRIGTFGADVRAVPLYDSSGNPVDSSSGRLLMPVRGDATMTVVDWTESGSDITLVCTPNPVKNSLGVTCSNDWKIGDVDDNARKFTLEGEPFSIAAPSYWPTDPGVQPRASGGIAAIVHQSLGDVSVFVHVNEQSSPGRPPIASLAYTLTNGVMPQGGTSIAAFDLVPTDPTQPFVPRFLVTNSTQPNIFQLAYLGDTGTVDRSALYVDDVIPISTNAPGYDSRGIVVDPPNDGENRPTRVFVTNRTPPSIVWGNYDPVFKKFVLPFNSPLPIGPSRVTRGVVNVPQSDGTMAKRTRIYASSFDGAWVTVIDPDRPTSPTLDTIRTGRGPYAFIVDPVRNLAFVTSFTESTVQVIDIDPTHAGTSPGSPYHDTYDQVIFTIGFPTLPAF